MYETIRYRIHRADGARVASRGLGGRSPGQRRKQSRGGKSRIRQPCGAQTFREPLALPPNREQSPDWGIPTSVVSREHLRSVPIASRFASTTGQVIPFPMAWSVTSTTD